IVVHLMLLGLALLVLLPARHAVGAAYSVERLSAGVLLVYAGVQLFFDFVGFCFWTAGSSLDSLHRTPIAARSLAEFWSQRWNLVVSAWLHAFVFLPLARRRCPRLGIICAFLVSGLLHGWVILVAIGIPEALAILLFFVVQGVFVLAEHRLRVHAWPGPVARGWTLAVLLASSPLIIVPYLSVFDL
ncbi:MAG TPA: MBOAT family protein, partial [Verrucomicrobiae bacterium]